MQQPNTSDKQQFSEEVLRQVLADARRALVRGRYSLQRSRFEHFRCIDYTAETENAFGRQLWFFDGIGVDELDRRPRIYGALEYSIQYGLHELVEDGIFEVSGQRERFRMGYCGHRFGPTWRHPAHRLLLAGLLGTSAAALAYLLLRVLAS